MKNKNQNIASYIIGIVFIVGVVALVIFAANNNGNSNPNSSSASLLTAPEDTFDFGTVSMAAGNVSRVFELKNEGTETVVIKKVYTSCMCTTAFITDSSGKKYGEFGMPGHGGLPASTRIEVKPGQIVSVEAVFDPAAHGPSGVGLAQRAIYLETNSEKTPRIELSFQATVTP